MSAPSHFRSLQKASLLQPDDRRLTASCLWLEAVQWVEGLRPEIGLPHGTSMVPFGVSAYGDWWAWELDGDDPDRFPIILSPPDTGDCTYYAPSFAAFLFRQILQFVSNDVYCDAPDPDEVRFTVPEMHAQLRIWATQLEGCLPKEWLDVIAQVTTITSLRVHVGSPKYTYRCLVLPAEVTQLERDLLQFSRMNHRFSFNRLDVDW